MQTFWNIADYQLQICPIVTLGVFDGVHLGHQKIISQCVTEAKEQHTQTTLITFDPHPRLVVNPNASVQLLQTIDEKLECFRKLGVDNVLVIPFTKEFSAISSTDFIKNILVNTLHIQKIIVGHDHFFGHSRQGGFSHLEDLSKIYRFAVEQIGSIKKDGMTVSSSIIRDALLGGNVSLAAKLLNKFYALSGNVVEGNKLGRSMGFNTANMLPNDSQKLVPSQGVYACLVNHNHQTYKSMTNIGVRPTVDGKNMVIETHLFDFSKIIYSQNITLQFVDRIREEVCFENTEALSRQLAQDKASAQKILERF